MSADAARSETGVEWTELPDPDTLPATPSVEHLTPAAVNILALDSATQIRAELEATGSYDEEQIAQLVNDIDEYTGHGVFWVPPTARWTYRSNNAKGLQAAMGERAKTIGELVDDAMDLLMGSNHGLAATLPRIFNRDSVDQRRMGE